MLTKAKQSIFGCHLGSEIDDHHRNPNNNDRVSVKDQGFKDIIVDQDCAKHIWQPLLLPSSSPLFPD